MTTVPHLQRLVGAHAPLVDVLALLCEQLGMSAAVLGHLEGDTHVVQLAVGADGRRRPDLEGPRPAAGSWCAQVPPDGPLVVPDTVAARGGTAGGSIGCYVGTPVLAADGRRLGVLGVIGRSPHGTLNQRDLEVLTGLAEVVAERCGPLLASAGASPTLPAAPALPSPRVAPDLGGLAEVLEGAHDLEGLTRPLLAALHELSGLASTYLTVVDERAGQQEIRYSRNARADFAVPEGLQAPWEDTLCRRALDEGRSCTSEVPLVWGDCGPAAELGIVTYASVPVRLSDGRLWGTLCGADDVERPDVAAHLPTLNLFARLIAAEVERAAAVESARERAVRARREADTDELTGCATRRTVLPWLREALQALPEGDIVVLAFVDVDDFKAVNDGWGHAVGDAALRELGGRLLAGARTGDLVARLGGDEFVVAARVPRGAASGVRARVRAAGALTVSTATGVLPVRCSTGFASSDDALDPDALLALSDAAMYRHKGGSRR